MDEPSDLISPPGWYPDPVHRFEFRWFNGRSWTADVSVDGRRFVDDLQHVQQPVAAQPGWAPVAVAPQPSRTLAVLALVLGLCSLALAWVPFLFVLAALGAIAAAILGIISLQKIRRQTATGRGMSIAGIATSVAALGLCVVGFLFTKAVVREIDEFTDPGPVEAVVTECTADGATVSMAGTVTNQDDRGHDYVITVSVRDDTGHRVTSDVEVDDVRAGDRQEWTSTQFVRDVDPQSVQCEVREVSGPTPFDIEVD